MSELDVAEKQYVSVLMAGSIDGFPGAYPWKPGNPTSRRAFGVLKCDGYQYPFGLVEEERLLVGYSVNKEDMECVSVPYAMLS